MNLGFVGLGQMGSGIARNLLRAGHQVTVYNRTREKAQALTADGARTADSPAAVSISSEAVMTMLADDHAVEQVVFGENGIAGELQPGAVHISHSTISIALARHLTSEHHKRGQGFLSVPVFGRPNAAEEKKLVVVAAGPSVLIDRFRPIFDAIGRQTFLAGVEPWQANIVKLCGNFMIASMLESFSEAIATLRKADVPPQHFVDIISTVFGSPVYTGYGSAIAAGKFEPAGFALKLGLKDVRLALAAAEECNAPMPFASVIRDQMIDAMAHGQAEQDWSSVARAAARSAGLELSRVLINNTAHPTP